MKYLRITMMTKIERNQAITSARETISDNGGWVVSHTLLSNSAANLNFELPLAKTETFIESLRTAGFSPDIDGDMPSGDEGDVRGNLMMTFLHNEPDLKQTVPAFG